MSAERPRVDVVGAINRDLVLRASRLPRPGETLGGATLSRVAGGKGGNQAVAAARLGAHVRMVGAIGDDGDGGELVDGLVAEGVDVTAVRRLAGATGVALIVVDPAGENQIVVAPGVNLELELGDEPLDGDAVVSQLEVPLEVVAEAGRRATGLFCLNASPALTLPASVYAAADLIVVNEHEATVLGSLPATTLVAITYGPAGAVLRRDGAEIARAPAPAVTAVDTVGAGDAFCAALVVSLLEGRDPAAALGRACAAGSIAATRPGAQPSLPTAAEVDGWPASR